MEEEEEEVADDNSDSDDNNTYTVDDDDYNGGARRSTGNKRGTGAPLLNQHGKAHFLSSIAITLHRNCAKAASKPFSGYPII